MALKKNPINVNDDNWYYEESKAICLVHQVKDEFGKYSKTDQISIPWKRMLESVKRKYPSLFK